MTAVEQRAHKRAWVIDRIAYGVLCALSLGILMRVEKSVELATALASWAHTVGSSLNLPFTNP